MTNERIPKWKTQAVDESCRTLECPGYDEYKDFRMEPSGYYALIRVDKTDGYIELAVCTKDHRIIRVFRGRRCQDVYHHIFREEEKSGVQWFTDKDHIAYLGKELKKAELLLNGKLPEYVQE